MSFRGKNNNKDNWISDLKTFSDNDIKTLAYYYNLPINRNIYSNLAKKISSGSKKAFLPLPKDLPYGGDINKAMQARDREAIKIIMAYRNELAKEAKPTISEPNPFPECNNDRDYISGEEWSQEYKPDLEIYFLKTPIKFIEYISKNYNVYCANKENFIKWIQDPSHEFRGWVSTQKNVEAIDDNGYGGRPSFFEKFIKLPVNFITLPTFHQWNTLEYLALPMYTHKRVGNKEGVFAVGALHGQLPGETIYTVIPVQNVSNILQDELKKIWVKELNELIHKGFSDTLGPQGAESVTEYYRYKNQVISLGLVEYFMTLTKKDFVDLFGDKYDEFINLKFDNGQDLGYIKNADNDIVGPYFVKILELLETTDSEPAKDFIMNFIKTKFANENIEKLDLNILSRLIPNITLVIHYKHEYDQTFTPNTLQYINQNDLNDIDIDSDDDFPTGGGDNEEHDLSYYLQHACESEDAYLRFKDSLLDVFVDDINAVDEYGRNALLEFLSYKCTNESIAIKVINLLKNAGADFSMTDIDDDNAVMMTAAGPFSAKVLKLVLENSPPGEIDHQSKYGYTALYECINNRDQEWEDEEEYYRKCTLLLKNKADPNVTNNNNESPIILAISLNDTRLVKILIRYGADVKNLIIYARYISMINLLLDNGANINAVDSKNNNILFHSIYITHTNISLYEPEDVDDVINELTEIVNVLIKRGINVNAQNNDGRTGLMLASKYGYPEIVMLLLENKADKNIKDKKNKTALDYAKNGDNSYEIVPLLSKS